MTTHANAALTPRHRLKVARLVVDEGWPISEIAARFQVSWPTVKRWVDRYLSGESMQDRSSRPKNSPTKTSLAVTKRCISLRMRLREGPVQLAVRVGVAPSTVHRILRSARLNRLAYLDRATGEWPCRLPSTPIVGEERHQWLLAEVDVGELRHHLLRQSATCDTIRNVSYVNGAADPADGPPRTRGGRPRDAGREAEILTVVAQLLAERGYEGVTFEEVARRAGASKPTLYRRWTSRREMVVAAVKAGPARRDDPDEIDTGSLRGDLLSLCERLVMTMHSTDSRTAMLLLQAGLEDPELCEDIERAAGPTGARLPPVVIDAAVRRGELPEDVDPFPFEEVAGAVLLLRRVNGLSADSSYLSALVDTVFIPALRATAQRSAALPAGIFSGHPAPAPTNSEGRP